MSGLLTKAEIAQGSMSNSECFDSPASSFRPLGLQPICVARNAA